MKHVLLLLLVSVTLFGQGFSIGTSDRSGSCSVANMIVANTTNGKYFQCQDGTWAQITKDAAQTALSSGSGTVTSTQIQNALGFLPTPEGARPGSINIAGDIYQNGVLVNITLAAVLRYGNTLAIENGPFTTFPVDTFAGLPWLRYLYLDANKLTTLPSGVFDGLTALETLYLNSNQLTTLPSGVFDGFTALERLYLNSNQLTTLPSGVFDGLTALQTMDLSSNKLDETSVNSTIASLVTNGGVNGFLYLQNGTNAVPTDTDSMAALAAAGWTITTN
jgi:hypothetical protein